MSDEFLNRPSMVCITARREMSNNWRIAIDLRVRSGIGKEA